MILANNYSHIASYSTDGSSVEQSTWTSVVVVSQNYVCKIYRCCDPGGGGTLGFDPEL